MKREIVTTNEAPKAIGTYSQAVKVGNTVYLSGQIPLDPASGEMVAGEIRAQITRVFDNLVAVAKAAGGSLQDVVKLNVFLTDLKNFPLVNEIMAQYFHEPGACRGRRCRPATRRAGGDGRRHGAYRTGKEISKEKSKNKGEA
jgi:reactive intermediate/imine deaminase